MKRLTLILFFIYVLINLVVGINHPFYLEEYHFAPISKVFAFGNLEEKIEAFKTQDSGPLNFIINGILIKTFGYYEWVVRLFAFFSSILLFFVLYFLGKEFFNESKSSWFAFFTGLSYPILMTSHFMLMDLPALVFSLFGLLYFIKAERNRKYLIIGSLFCMIAFFFKQYGIAPAILLFYFLYKKLDKYIIFAFLITGVPILSWIAFMNFYIGGLISRGFSFETDIVQFMRKIGWIIYMIGFLTFVFLPFYWKELSKKSLLWILLLPFGILGFDFLKSTVSRTGNSIHGSIPLLYHALPPEIYKVLMILFFISALIFLNYLSKIRFNSKLKLVLITLLTFIILISLKKPVVAQVAIVEIRHMIYLLPLLMIFIFKKVKLNKIFFIGIFGMIIYSILWVSVLIALSNTFFEVSEFMNEREGKYYGAVRLIYVDYDREVKSLDKIDEIDYFITGQGFSENKINVEKKKIKSFDVKIFGIRISEVDIFEKV